MALATAMAMVMAGTDGNGNGNGDGNGDGNGQRQWQWQWPMVMATGMANSNGNSNSNGNGMAMARATATMTLLSRRLMQGRVASSCAGDVQHCGRGDVVPLPPWTQRSMHCPALRHGGAIAKSVFSISRGRDPESSPWIGFLLLLFTATVQFTKQPFVPPHHSGTQ
jgi:hypothetical protein